MSVSLYTSFISRPVHISIFVSTLMDRGWRMGVWGVYGCFRDGSRADIHGPRDGINNNGLSDRETSEQRNQFNSARRWWPTVWSGTEMSGRDVRGPLLLNCRRSIQRCGREELIFFSLLLLSSTDSPNNVARGWKCQYFLSDNDKKHPRAIS